MNNRLQNYTLQSRQAKNVIMTILHSLLQLYLAWLQGQTFVVQQKS